MSEDTSPESGGPLPIDVGWRTAGQGWRRFSLARDGGSHWATPDIDIAVAAQGGTVRIAVRAADAQAVEVAFDLPAEAQVFGGGERFESLDLRGRTIRHYLENFGLGDGTYLPVPWLATTAGFGLFVPGDHPATFHVGPRWDPGRLVVQIEAPTATIEVDTGRLPDLYAKLVARIGPPLMPPDSFFGLWKAGDWRIENAATVAADIEGFAGLGLPMAVKLIDAYWEDEVHSFAFDRAKYPDPAALIARLRQGGTETHLWLCPWVVVGTRSHAEASAQGYLIGDRAGAPITRRPGANPNVVAALIDFSNPAARRWWAESLAALLDAGIAGFKADFGEQLPEHAVLASGESGGTAHNAYVRHYLEATIAAFRGKPPNIISRSGHVAVRAPIWTGDQTSDFCPKAGLAAAIRACQSASFCGWSFVGSDIGGYFGTPTPQVFARWTAFAAFTPLMMLHGLGCREPWAMDAESRRIYANYARLHLALAPYFHRFGRIAATGGPPLIRMMPYAFPDEDWRGRNDWDQQFLLGDDILVAPSAFYLDTRAAHVPAGRWFDLMTQEWIGGPCRVVREVPTDAIMVFVRAGARIALAEAGDEGAAMVCVFEPLGEGEMIEVPLRSELDGTEPQRWAIWRLALVGAGGPVVLQTSHGPAVIGQAGEVPELGVRALLAACPGADYVTLRGGLA